MISYFYPPIGIVTAERALAYSRLLPEFGWEPVVLAPPVTTLVSIPAGPGMEIPPGVTVRRSRNPDMIFRVKRALGFEMSQTVEDQLPGEGRIGERPSGLRMGAVRAFKNWVEMPDRMIDWYPFLMRAALRAVGEFGPRVVCTTCPPYTSALAGARLKERMGLPWVVDLPDLWTRDFTYFRTGPAVRVDRRLERRALTRASAVVVNSALLQSALLDAHPALRGRTSVIPLAYDDDLFKDAEPVTEDLFNIVYAGTLHYPHQDIRPFFDALRELSKEGKDLSRFAFQYMGRDGRLVNDLAVKAGVGGLVRTLGQVPYAEALARQKGAKALLYIQWEPGGEVVATTKLMQYLGARLPIVAFAPTGGDADVVLSRTRAGEVARSAEELKGIIGEWLDEYAKSGSVSYHGDEGAIISYGYRSATKRLAGVLDDATSGR